MISLKGEGGARHLNLRELRAKLLREYPTLLHAGQRGAQAAAGAKRKAEEEEGSAQETKRARLPLPGVTSEEEGVLTEEIGSIFLSEDIPEIQEMFVRLADPITRQALANVNVRGAGLVREYYEQRATLEELLEDFAWHVDKVCG